MFSHPDFIDLSTVRGDLPNPKQTNFVRASLPQYKFVGTITRKGKMSLVGYSYAVWLQRGILLSENVSPDHQLWSMFLLILIQKEKPSPGQKPPKKA